MNLEAVLAEHIHVPIFLNVSESSWIMPVASRLIETYHDIKRLEFKKVLETILNGVRERRVPMSWEYGIVWFISVWKS